MDSNEIEHTMANSDASAAFVTKLVGFKRTITETLTNDELKLKCAELLRSALVGTGEEVRSKGLWYKKKMNNGKVSNDEVLGVRFVCSRAGESIAILTSERKRTRVSARCSCPASIYISVTSDEVGTLFQYAKSTPHNHELNTSPLASARDRMTEIYQKLPKEQLHSLLKSFLATGLRPNKIRDLLHYTYQVQVDLKDLLNVLQQIKQQDSGVSDAVQFVNNLTKIKESGGFYECQYDSEGRIQNVVWADKDMVLNAQKFADVCLLDTCANRNKYSLPLLFICGINGEGKTAPFMNGILRDESNDSWTWVLERFRKLVDGHVVLRSFFSDSDLAILATLKDVFPYSRHFLCVFHIYLNLNKNLAGVLREDYSSFFKDFVRCRNVPLVAEFEKLFSELKAKYSDARHYLEEQLEPRKKKWALAYGCFEFTIETAATSRVEGLNHSLADIGAKKLTELIQHLEYRHKLMRREGDRDIMMRSMRIAELMRGDECHVFGHLRSLLVRCLTGFAAAKVAKQMEFAQSYKVKVWPALKDALEYMTELKDLDMPNPASSESLTTLITDDVDDLLEECNLELGDILCTYKQLAKDRCDINFKVVTLTYQFEKAASSTRTEHLLILYDDGGYFCSCGFPARVGLPCRHFLASYLTEKLEISFNCFLNTHPRWWKTQSRDLPKWSEATASKNAYIKSQSFSSALEKQESLWELARLTPSDTFATSEEENELSGFLFGTVEDKVSALNAAERMSSRKRLYTQYLGKFTKILKNNNAWSTERVQTILQLVVDEADNPSQQPAQPIKIDFEDAESRKQLKEPAHYRPKGRPKNSNKECKRFLSGGEINKSNNNKRKCCPSCGNEGHGSAKSAVCPNNKKHLQ